MNDLRTTIIPKSDQLNSDDLIGRELTIKVSSVSLLAEADQPVAIGFDGDCGKPYKPCKSMRRVMVSIWGPDGNAYIGRSMTLYRDPGVQFGGMAVGGIRISHMSHIEKPVTMALTATRANRKPFTVNPLVEPPPPKPRASLADWISALPGVLADCADSAAIDALTSGKIYQAALGKATEAQKADMQAHIAARLEQFVAPASDDDGWPGPDPDADKEAA